MDQKRAKLKRPSAVEQGSRTALMTALKHPIRGPEEETFLGGGNTSAGI